MRNRMEEILGAVDNGQRHDASAAACWRLTGLDAFLHASVVMLYTPLAHEVDLTAAALCCFRSGKTVCIPRVNRNGRDLDPVVVPGLAFDPHGNRLGRGGRCYDRFLGRLRRSATTVGVVFDLQIVEEVPAPQRDVTVDVVVTDRRVTHTARARSRR
jgi:5-formyltetrahydrofolate cyclo-ligase